MTDEAAKELAAAMRKLADAIENARSPLNNYPAPTYPSYPSPMMPGAPVYGDPLDYRNPFYTCGARTFT